MEDDGDDKDDSKRRTRNMSEKKRRDQFNLLVNELSTMVSSNNRKMDKSTVLKSTISFLKNHNEITVRSRVHDIQEDWKPAFLSNEEFTYLVLEALEGFVMVLSASGLVYYVSESITSLLGHNMGDVVNKSIFDLAFEDDHPNLYNILQGPGTAVDTVQRGNQDKEIRFQCHLRRGTLDFRDESTYELVEFSGHFRTNTEPLDKEDLPYRTDHESRLFVCTGRLHTPQLIRDVSLVDSNRNEFTSRHSFEWKFLFLDHRAPPIIGYLPFEVLGTSGYDYYHFDDLEKVVNCHEALMQKGELTSCYYRFLTKGQQWIWLQSRFYITYHQWNSKPEFVVCTHRVVNYADVAKSGKQETVEPEPVVQEVLPEEPKESKAEEPIADMSPTYMSEACDSFAASYSAVSRPASVKSASGSSTGTTATTGAPSVYASWPRTCTRYASSESSRYAPAEPGRYAPGCDTGSLSGESRSSQRNTTRSLKNEPMLVPQRAIGAQYLEPAPYVGAVSVPGVPAPMVSVVPALPGVLPLSLPSLPVIVTPDQAQIQWPWQEQLQQKHEELQQMIVRQQEELRQVKEQLLLARLGMLEPLPAVPNPYLNNETQNPARLPAELVYEESDRALAVAGFPPPPPPRPHPPQ
ncbi:circadian locomoter output cycles protein kaput isoform X3 [Cydia pomonella]|uniref:circadian locomoter output cycles protein kaput isoform X3 n=1 Tax=Cydia pomonella TaxID=82600 RepID=UPI002ADD62C2|nr:circadian locomoter output cycles protein kaput isoform X3 [Cydia pomonella]